MRSKLKLLWKRQRSQEKTPQSQQRKPLKLQSVLRPCLKVSASWEKWGERRKAKVVSGKEKVVRRKTEERIRLGDA